MNTRMTLALSVQCIFFGLLSLFALGASYFNDISLVVPAIFAVLSFVFAYVFYRRYKTYVATMLKVVGTKESSTPPHPLLKK